MGLGVIFGILLTEIKVLGLSLRSPLLSFLFAPTKLFKQIILPSLVLLFYVFFVASGDVNLLEKSNITVFFISLFGFFVMFSISFFITQNKKLEYGINFVILIFILMSLLQLLGYNFWINFFGADIGQKSRSTGFSSEPSFFANMLFYFYLVSLISFKNNKIIYTFVFFFLLFLTKSLTAVSYLLVLISIFLLFKIRLGQFRINPFLMIIIFPFLLVIINIYYTFICGNTLPLDLYLKTGSWRELSTYSAFHGAQLIGPFSGGQEWSDILNIGSNKLINKLDYNLSWVVWPWSLFAMLLCEIGILPTFLILCICGKRINRFWYKYPEIRNNCYIYSISFIVGMFLAPKWCVYYFFLPLLTRRKD